MNLNINEIRDYLERAPKRIAYNGMRMVNTTGFRLTWLADLCRGTINERINRRAGIVDSYTPWTTSPTHKAISRNNRRKLKRKYGYIVN